MAFFERRRRAGIHQMCDSQRWFQSAPALFLSELSNDQSILILKRQLDSPF